MRLLPRIAILALSTTSVSALAAPGDRTITILHTNDMHGRHAAFHVAPGDATAQTGEPPENFARSGMIGGFAHLAGAVRAVREKEGAGNVLLVDGGDTFGDDLVGNATEGAAMVTLMNALGYQFMGIGNHDFDYGVERTRALQALAQFPMRGANVLDESTGSPLFGDPTKVIEVGGVRVGIMGMGYHNTAQTGSKENVEGVRFISGIDAARRHLPALKAKSDIVVVVSHQGTGVDRVLAQKVPGIDIIISAHSHDLISPPEKVGNTWLVQALSDDAMLGKLSLTIGPDNKIAAVNGKVIALWNDTVQPDPEIADLVAKLDAPFRQRMTEVLATAEKRIPRQYESESPFDSLAGEILRERTGAQIAFLPGVGYGVSIEAGPVARDRLYTLLPHPTKMTTLTMTGRQILAVLEQSATNQEPEDPLDKVGGLVQTSGLRWTVDLGKPSGHRISGVRVGDRRLEKDARYRVVTNESMSQGLHRYSAFKEGSDVVVSESSVTDIVEAGLIKRGRIAPPPVGAITLIKPSKHDARNPPNRSLYKALGSPENWKISGTQRSRVEAIGGQFRPNAAVEDFFLSFRTTLFAEYDTGPVRIGAEFYDARGYLQEPNSSVGPTEVNAAEFAQAYLAVDLEDALGAGSTSAVTTGRFTLDLGSRRLVSRQSFSNATNSFTGVLLERHGSQEDDRIDLFWTMPQIRLPRDSESIRDNEVEWDRESTDLQFYGASIQKPVLPGGGTVEVYGYALAERDSLRFPTRNRRLFTPGIRFALSPKQSRIDYDFEGIYQTGRTRRSDSPGDVADLDVNAYYAHAELGYTGGASWSPRISFQFDYGSGDGQGSNYNRFDGLFGTPSFELNATGLYGAINRANIVSPGVRFEAGSDKSWSAMAMYRAFWLDSASDSFAATGVQDPQGSSGRFAGHQFELRAAYHLTSAVRLAGGAAYLAKGRFLDTAPNSPRTGDTRYGFFDLSFLF